MKGSDLTGDATATYVVDKDLSAELKLSDKGAAKVSVTKSGVVGKFILILVRAIRMTSLCFIVFYCVLLCFNFGSILTGNWNDVVVFYSQAGWNGSYGGTGARSGGYATACFRVRATACTTHVWRRSQTRWWRWRSTGWMRRSRYEQSERPRRRNTH